MDTSATAESTLPDLDRAVFDGFADDLGLDYLIKVAGTFRVETAERIAQLMAALDSSDAKGIARAAHSLKGAAATIGLMRLSAAASRVERIARGGGTAELASDIDQIVALHESGLDVIYDRIDEHMGSAGGTALKSIEAA